MTALVPTTITEAVTLSEIMAKASLVPDHLRNKPGDCLLVVMQAQRWGMDPVSVAQCTSVVKGKLCYEGKLVAAALYAMGAVEGRLRYEYSGSGEGRKIVVTGRARGTDYDQSVEGTVADWKTANDAWKRASDDMLAYRGTRQWARRYAPEALLGVYTPDELSTIEPETVDARVVATVPAGVAQPSASATPKVEPATLPEYPAEDFAQKFPLWQDYIDGGKASPADIIAKIETRYTMTGDQKAALYDLSPIDSGDAP
jgi:hypothetical protein